MADLGGFVEGAIAGQEYSQRQQMFPLKMQETQLDIKDKDLVVQRSKLLLDQQKKMMEVMNGINAKGSQDPTERLVQESGYLQQVGHAQVAAGMYEEGGKTLERSTLMLQQHENIMKRTNDVQLQQLQHASELLGGAEDQKGADQAVMMFQSFYPEEAKNPNIQKIFELMKHWTPELKKALQSGIQTAKDKALTEQSQAAKAAEEALTRERNYRVGVLMPLEAKDIKDRMNHRDKAGANDLNPSKDDIADATNRIQSDPDLGGKIPKAAAATVAEKIAESTAQYRKQGLSRSAASDKAYKEAKERGDLRNLAAPKKAPAEVETAVNLIDRLLTTLDQADAAGIEVTGGLGKVRQVEEFVGPKLGRHTAQISHQFESDLATLQGLVQKPIYKGGYFSKLKQEEIETIARGRKTFDTKDSSRESLRKLRETLTGAKTPEKIAVNDAGDKMALIDGKWVPYDGR